MILINRTWVPDVPLEVYSFLNFSFHIVIYRAGRAFLDSRSRGPGVLGTQAHGNAIFFKARGNTECEEVGTLISRA